MKDIRLLDIGERGLLGLINQWTAGFASSPDPSPLALKCVLGIGDDCAAMAIDENRCLLISNDLFSEGVHFRREYCSPEQIGCKSLVANISDIAAMGGTATHALVGLSLPSEIEIDFVEQFFKALVNTGKGYGIQIIGGDSIRSPGPLMIGITILGVVEKEKMVTRKGAQPGDKIMITGELGGAMAGLEILERFYIQKDKGIARYLESKSCLRFLYPTPRVKESKVIAGHNWATSMIDLSDSLTQSLAFLCQASGVGAQVFKDRLPIASEAKEIIEAIGGDRYTYALSGGEEYELLFTVRPENSNGLKSIILNETGSVITEIGEIHPAHEGLAISDETGRNRRLQPLGFEHF